MDSSWDKLIREYTVFLRLEKSLSENSIEAYINDIRKLQRYFEMAGRSTEPEDVTLNYLKQFIEWINNLGMSPRTQARVISGIKGFYKYLMLEDVIQQDPTSLIESPKIGRKLPDVCRE